MLDTPLAPQLQRAACSRVSSILRKVVALFILSVQTLHKEEKVVIYETGLILRSPHEACDLFQRVQVVIAAEL